MSNHPNLDGLKWVQALNRLTEWMIENRIWTYGVEIDGQPYLCLIGEDGDIRIWEVDAVRDVFEATPAKSRV